ncbi:MAG TPA: hypothetical protein VH092_12930 [Urbifossiella sp.]|jgi:hypothetical protein|nr:hypothetical protein [Urbifossiella sp.]
MPGPPVSAEWPSPTWLRLVAFALVSRLIVLAAGLLLAPQEPGPHWTADQLAFRAEILAGPVWWLEPWVRFDAGYYLAIAREGYHPPAEGEGPNAGFLPLLPALIALAAAVGVNPILAGVVIPNAAFVAGLACAGRVGWHVTGSARTAWLGCGVLVTYPFAFYFSAPYQESLYLLATAGGLLAWYERRPGLAGVMTLLAATARLTAVAFPLGLFAEAAARHRRPSPGAWFVAAGTTTGVLVFAAYLGYAFGDPLAHFKAHAAWGRESPSLGGVGRSLASAASELIRPNPAYAVVKPLALFGTIALGVRGWVRRGPLWGCLILVPVAQALSTGTTLSIERIVLTSFPAAFEAGELLGRSRMMQIAWVLIAVPAQLFFLWLFVNNGFLN